MNYLRMLVGSSLLACACGDVAGGADDHLGSERAPITGGNLVPANQNLPPDSSAIRFQTDANRCSAIKVNTNEYWTAGHCVSDQAVGDMITLTNDVAGTLPGPFTTTFKTIDLHPSLRNGINTSTLKLDSLYYDIARFTLNATNNIPPYPTVDSNWVAQNQEVTFTGYGCDAMNSTHNDKKQWALFNTVDEFTFRTQTSLQQTLTEAIYAHEMIALGIPQACGGDSGSPVWKQFGGIWKTVGIVTRGETLNYSNFARYSNVRSWLKSPAVNQFVAGFKGFIFNRYTRRCLQGSSTPAVEANCDGRFQDTDAQSWTLKQALPSTFFIVNGKTGKCLGLNDMGENALVVLETCNSGAQTQMWRFVRLFIQNELGYYQIQSAQTSRCTAPETPTSDVAGFVRSRTCVTTGTDRDFQTWVMTR